MKKIRKFLLVLFMLVLMFAVFASGTKEKVENSIRVSTSANSGRPGLEAVAPIFEKETGIKINTEFGDLGTDTYTATLMTQLRSGSAPDIFAVFAGTGTSSPNVGMMVEAGQLYELSETEYAKRLPGTATEPVVTIDGKIYAACLGIQMVVGIYNTELFEKYDLQVPTTWNEFLKVVEKIRKVAPSKTPVAFGGGNTAISMINTQLLLVNQPTFTGREGYEESFSNSVAWRGALSMIQDLINVKAFSPSASTDGSNEIVSSFVAGDSFMTFDCSSRFTAIKKADPNCPIAMFALPARDSKDTRVMLWPGTMAAVNKNARNIDATLQFFEYITDIEGSGIWIAAAGGSEMPSSQLYDVDRWLPHFESLKPFANTSIMIPCVTWPTPTISNALGSGVGAMLAGVYSIDDVLKDMDEAWKNN
jgi:raffinose/stachyose/melibiose transport system substrate-binding protein